MLQVQEQFWNFPRTNGVSKMKTRYKILIIASIAFFIYWPVIPLVALSCMQITENEICYEIARLRIPITVDGVWNDVG